MRRGVLRAVSVGLVDDPPAVHCTPALGVGVCVVAGGDGSCAPARQARHGSDRATVLREHSAPR
jgi:hypothetical protein